MIYEEFLYGLKPDPKSNIVYVLFFINNICKIFKNEFVSSTCGLTKESGVNLTKNYKVCSSTITIFFIKKFNRFLNKKYNIGPSKDKQINKYLDRYIFIKN